MTHSGCTDVQSKGDGALGFEYLSENHFVNELFC